MVRRLLLPKERRPHQAACDLYDLELTLDRKEYRPPQKIVGLERIRRAVAAHDIR